MEYCRWLSSRTGKAYRLPTEAEWEYAARAGTKTAYHFGDDESKLGDYAWFDGNNMDHTHPVGTKKANPWGLHDMYGNVMEWCVDHYTKDFYAKSPADKLTLCPVNLPTEYRFSHVARGGSWLEKAKDCRSASRKGSDKTWIKDDPQKPQSIWWLTNSDFVGFRVVRAVEEYPELKGIKSKVTRQSRNGPCVARGGLAWADKSRGKPQAAEAEFFQVLSCASRARARQSQNHEVLDDASGRVIDFTYILQGRDSSNEQDQSSELLESFHGGGRRAGGRSGVLRRAFMPRAAASSRSAWSAAAGRGTERPPTVSTPNTNVKLVAIGDAFEDRAKGLVSKFSGDKNYKNKIDVGERVFVGLDAYKKVIENCDLVILATPPGFRPIHIEAAVAAKKHIFTEKPCAVDGAGIRKVLKAYEDANAAKLCVVAGTQRRHQTGYLESMKRIHGGDIGDILAARCYWNQGKLWNKKREHGQSDLAWQLRNWLYFTWLSGDHICEQHVHNLDVVNWAMASHPTKAQGMGGRQVRTGPEFGQIFDHFAIEYEYPNGAHLMSMCRQIEGTHNDVSSIGGGIEGDVGTPRQRPRNHGRQGRGNSAGPQ